MVFVLSKCNLLPLWEKLITSPLVAVASITAVSVFKYSKVLGAQTDWPNTPTSSSWIIYQLTLSSSSGRVIIYLASHYACIALARLIIICLCAIFDQVLRLGFYFSVCLSLLCIAQFLQPGISDLTNCSRNWCILSSIMQSRYRNGEYICPGRGNREVISTVSSIAVNKIRKETLPKAQRTRGPRLSSFNKLIALK